VEAAVGGEEPVGGKDVEVRVEDEVVAEGVDSGDGSDAAVGEAEAGAEGVLEGGGGSVEQVGEEVAAFAKDAAQDARHGEDELAVGNRFAECLGDPVAGAANAALVAGRAEVAALAGEGEEALVAAVGIRADEAGESGAEIAALVEAVDGRDGGGAVAAFVVGEEVAPGVVDNLTSSMQFGFAMQECRSTRRGIATAARRGDAGGGGMVVRC